MKLRRKGIRAWFHKIGPRIACSYFLVAVLTIVIAMSIYQNIAMDYARSQVNAAANQTVATVRANVRQMLTVVDNYSKLIFSNSNLKTLLRSGSVQSNLPLQSRVNTFLYNLMQAVPAIESIYIFDFSGNYFRVSGARPVEFVHSRVEEAAWYEQVVNNRGINVLSLNGDGAFSDPDGESFLTLAKLIRDVNTINNLGIMALNIPESALTDIYEDALSENAMAIAVFDERGERVARFEDCTAEREAFLRECALREDSEDNIALFDGQEYLVARQRDADRGWIFVGMTPAGSIDLQSRGNVFTVTLLFGSSIAVFLVVSILIFHSFTKPINRLLRTMSSAQEGNYDEIAIQPAPLEFEQLYEQYNRMISRLKMFHERHMREQETIRKSELNVLQAQINPHFLYNTLDSIVALAMMGDSEQVCRISEALARYYRLSVSKGRDVILLKEDLQILKNYMIIQEIRYRDIYKIHYDVDESCLSIQIPKLVLQPLVENALYHGLRAKGGSGNIYVSIHRVDSKIEISIRDDGVGMSAQRIREILDGASQGDAASFGLWGTLERIRIYYGEESQYHIESVPGDGTTIVLRIPEGKI